jgi:uncharacterized membrane protein
MMQHKLQSRCLSKARSIDKLEKRVVSVKRSDLLIDGQICPSTSGQYYPLYSPVDGTLVAEVADATKADVDRAVAAAREAFYSEWKFCGVEEKCSLFANLKEVLHAMAEELAAAKVQPQGGAGIPPLVDRVIDYYVGKLDDGAGTLIEHGDQRTNYVYKEPLGVVAIFALGLVVSSRLTRWVYRLIESPLRHLPVVKDLYSALKQLTVLLAPQNKEQMGKVVSVKHPELAVNMVGLMMRDDVRSLDDAIASDDMVAVYFPMSYQIGGYTLFVPRAWVSAVDMPVEAAMRNALTGWMKEDTETTLRNAVTKI